MPIILAFKLGGKKVAHEIATKIASKYAKNIGYCDDCAKEIAEELRRAGISGEIIKASTGSSSGIESLIMSKSLNKQIGDQGYHMGVVVDGKVFDNIHTNGIPVGQWIQDFESRTSMVIEKTKF